MKKLILLHGALGDQSQFQPWLPLLSAHFEVHTLNFEGHGDRNAPERPFRIAHFAENLETFIQENSLQGVHIFGYSMGGYVALFLALRQPELVGKIFTFASKLDWNPATSQKEVRMLDADIIATKVPHFAQALEKRHTGAGWRAVLEKTAEMMLHLGNQNALQSGDFAQIQNPVQMGIGDKDNMVTIEETVAAYRQLPNGKLLVMPGTPHPIEKIHPARICGHILTFINGK